MAGYLRQVPPGEGLDDTSDVAARRVQNWIYAWAAFAAAPAFGGLRAGFDHELLDGIADHAAYIRENLTAERNHRTLELYALLIVALALPELDRDGELLRFAMAELHANLMADVARRRPPRAVDALPLHRAAVVPRRARERPPLRPRVRRGYDEHLARACEFAMHCHRPDGTIAALGDSDSGSYADLLELAADLLDREDLRWAATAGAAGEPPARRYVSFGAGGYHLQRSGWGDRGRPFADERWLIFDCGPLGDGGHGHYDLLKSRSPPTGARSSSTRAATPTTSRCPTSATGSRARPRTTPSSSTASTRRRTGAASRARARSPAAA